MDFARASMLIHILDKAVQWPSLRPLHDAALAELIKIQSPPTPAPKAIPSASPRRIYPENSVKEEH